MAQGYFITGTDTNAGKTWVTVALLRNFATLGKRVVGMKPVAAGCDRQSGVLVNSDALQLLQASNVAVSYAQVNPYAYALPVSPHLAGQHRPVELAVLQQRYAELAAIADVVVVEGAGGWYSPLTATIDNAVLAQHLALPVILCVPIRLGCINQARLSVQAIEQSQVACVGWIAVCVEADMLLRQENIDYLQAVLSVPLLGVLPFNASAEAGPVSASVALDNLQVNQWDIG